MLYGRHDHALHSTNLCLPSVCSGVLCPVLRCFTHLLTLLPLLLLLLC